MRKIGWSLAGAFLLVVSGSVWGADVTVKTEPLTLPWWTSTPGYAKDPKALRAMQPVKDSQKAAGERTFQTVVLENEYVRVQVIPELGGVVYRAVYKAANGGKGTDFFYCEQKAKDWLPWWESGVKMSYPYYEHGLSTDNQPASYTVVRKADGSATLAMFMDFSRHNEAYQRKRYGRFSTMFATQEVTVVPGDATFSVGYRMTNPTPFRQGRRMWNDTYFPRTDTAEGPVMGAAAVKGPTTAELVLPTTWVSDHGAASLREFMGKTKLSEYGGMMSLFAWEPLGFAGVYYPETQTSRLRITDPKTAPGAKFWFLGEPKATTVPAKTGQMFNYVELWSGTDHVFEGIENWIGPGESYSMEYVYALVPHAGYPLMVNADVAVTRDAADAGKVMVSGLRAAMSLEVAVDGVVVGKVGGVSPMLLGVTVPAAEGKAFVISLGGRKVYEGPIPPKLREKDGEAHKRIVESIKGAYNAEMRGNADEWGSTFEAAIGKYAEGSTDKGRVLYRAGKLDAAMECLTKATGNDAEDGEAWHLLGVTLLEQGKADAAKGALEKAVAAKRSYPASRYYLALLKIAAGDKAAAKLELETLIGERAGVSNDEAMLLAAALAADPVKAAQACVDRNPADPRARWLAKDEAALAALLKEPGAQGLVDGFVAATQGKFTPPARLK